MISSADIHCQQSSLGHQCLSLSVLLAQTRQGQRKQCVWAFSRHSHSSLLSNSLLRAHGSHVQERFPSFFHLSLLRPAGHRKGGTPGLTLSSKWPHRKDQENASKEELLGVEDCQQDINRKANTHDECIKTNRLPLLRPKVLSWEELVSSARCYIICSSGTTSGGMPHLRPQCAGP